VCCVCGFCLRKGHTRDWQKAIFLTLKQCATWFKLKLLETRVNLCKLEYFSLFKKKKEKITFPWTSNSTSQQNCRNNHRKLRVFPWVGAFWVDRRKPVWAGSRRRRFIPMRTLPGIVILQNVISPRVAEGGRKSSRTREESQAALFRDRRFSWARTFRLRGNETRLPRYRAQAPCSDLLPFYD